jgi:hypothetical protein
MPRELVDRFGGNVGEEVDELVGVKGGHAVLARARWPLRIVS